VIVAEAHDASGAEELFQDLRRAVGRRVVDREHAESLMGLSSEGRERSPDPGGSVAHDDNGEHAWDVHGIGLA
jgi:hypothetical protein